MDAILRWVESTNLTLTDWLIMIISVVALRFISLSTRRYMKGVADFLSANRSAGRYLLTIAGQMGGTGAISIVAMFEVYYAAGFPPVWWGFMSIPVGAVILLTGWVYYRFRETRALTMAQFFEMRYSKNFRVFAGFLCWSCGVLNFGIFPAVAARFLIYFCGLPEHFVIPGIPFEFSTFLVVMAIDLMLALTFVNMGGQISVMVTEVAQGMVSAFIFIVVSGAVLLKLSWPQIVTALNMAPENASMLHPFHTSNVENFNVWFFLIGIFGSFYGANSWQGSQAFNSAGRSPHEQKMGGIIGIWRWTSLTLMIFILPIAAYAVMHLPEFSHMADQVNAGLKAIPNEAVKGQMTVPLVLAALLPTGIKGLLATVMLFFSFTCHDTYMHSWGSIGVQDVYRPIAEAVSHRRTRLAAFLSRIFRVTTTPEQHIRLLRYSIIFVALFAFFFSWWYQPTNEILFFFAITSTIWAGGSGACIIGGLYWKKGTTAAAYSALILGAIVGVGGLVVEEYWPDWYGHKFPINGQWLWMLAMLGAIVVYTLVSLATCRRGREFNLERMLCRGQYRDPNKPVHVETTSRWLQLVGITKEFTIYDKILAIALIAWNGSWFLLFIGATAFHFLIRDLGTDWWAGFWHAYIWMLFAISIPATVWFTVGGILDTKALFHTLATSVRDHTDDGRVVRDPSLDPVSEESAAMEPVPDEA